VLLDHKERKVILVLVDPKVHRVVQLDIKVHKVHKVILEHRVVQPVIKVHRDPRVHKEQQEQQVILVLKDLLVQL